MRLYATREVSLGVEVCVGQPGKSDPVTPQVRVHLNRGGNRRLNCALQVIAVTQGRGIGPGKDYLERPSPAASPHRGTPAAPSAVSGTVFTALGRTRP
jgi:hypothetical protein